MTEEQLAEIENKAIEKMLECNDMGTEIGHIKADEIIFELLNEIGLKKIAKVYDSVSKWYA